MSREFYVPCQPYAYPASAIMSDEASSSSARMQQPRATAAADDSSRGFQVTNTSAETGKTRRPSVISGFRDRLRSRLSSSGVGNRLKSLIRWREMKQRVSSSKQPTTTTTTSASSFEDISLAASVAVDSTLESAISEAGNRLTTTTTLPSASRIEEEDNPGAPPPPPSPRNLIESNLVSSSFDPAATSSFVSARSSMPSHQGDDREVTSSTYPQASNSTTNASDSSNLTENTDDEVNPINGQDPLGLPSAVIGVQLQTAAAAATSSMGATRILDVIPILFIQSGGSVSLGNSRSTTTEESFASTSTGSSGGGGGTTTEDSSNESSSSSASAVIEIVTPMDESARRFERDYVRPYYDLSFRPTVRKHFRRLDDDPPIY